MEKPRLTYFSSRGLAEVIRILLADVGVDYDEMAVGTWDPAGMPAAFLELRERGVLAFDALPLWEEPGGFRLVQSGAILRHLARTHHRYGDTAYEAARCDQWLAGVDDLRVDVRKLVSVAPTARADLRQEMIAAIVPRWLGRFERLLAANGDHGGVAVGARASVADIALWYLLETLSDNGLVPTLTEYPRLTELYQRIGERPGIAAHRRSPRRYPSQLLPT